MEDLKQCLLCYYNSISNIGDSWVTVTRGLKNIIHCSKQSGDGLHEKLFEVDSLKVHVRCRKVYTDGKRIAIAKKWKIPDDSDADKPRSVIRRSTEEAIFNVKEDCLFCAISQQSLVSSLRGRLDKTNELIAVRRIDWKAELQIKALKRDDEWAFLVHSRIARLGDLVAAESKYHALYMTDFCKGRSNRRMPKQIQSKLGRKPNEKLSYCLEKLYLYLEENNECQYTLNELHGILNSFTDESDMCTIKWLKQKLINHYGSDIMIADAFGQKDIICFKDFGFRVLRKKWAQYWDVRTCNEVILDMAAGILRNKIRIMQYDNSTYPSFSSRDNSSIVPNELDRFLHGLIKSKAEDQTSTNRRCSSIAEAITAAVRPRSFVSPLLLAISSFTYRKYAAKVLITILHKLGFAEGYDEIELLNTDFLEADGMQQDFSGSILQTVWDNADKNARTLTGFDTFHALGGIAVSTPKREPIERILKRSSAKILFPGKFKNHTNENIQETKRETSIEDQS